MDIGIHKGVVTALIIIAGALVTSACSKKTYTVNRFIDASPQAVWDVLMDTPSYGAWNPVFVKVEGRYAEGGSVVNTFKDPSGQLFDVTNKVVSLVPQKQLRQKGGVPLVITFDHQWLLQPEGNGTRVTQYEVDRGFYVWFWDDSWIIPSYTDVLVALDKQVMQRR